MAESSLFGRKEIRFLETLIREKVDFMIVGLTAATGSMYEGWSRYYSLQEVTELGSGSWSNVAGHSGIAGTGEDIDYTNMPPSDACRFYRLTATLR